MSESDNQVNTDTPGVPISSPVPSGPGPASEVFSYPIASIAEIDSMSSADAAQVLERILSDASCDEMHPYVNRNHPQYRAYRERMPRLFELKAAGSDNRSEIERACDAALSMKVEKQNALVAEGQREVKLLEKFGYSDTIPDDFQEYQLTALRLQRLACEEKFGELTPLLEKELQVLKAPADTVAAFTAFNQAESLDPVLKSGIIEKILQWVYEANKQKYSGDK